MRMLVTRPEPDAQSTIARLHALDIEAVAAPLMTRQLLEFHLPPPEGFAGLAITSANTLRALVDSGRLAELLHLKVFAVGDRTALEARQLGFADVAVAGGTLGSLMTAIILDKPTGPILYPAARHRSGDLAQGLATQGILVSTVAVYEMVAETVLPPAILADLEDGTLAAVLLYSQRTAEIFCALAAAALSPACKRNLAVFCLSEKVAEPLLAAHFTRVHLADKPDEDAMMTLALAFAREQTGP